MVLAGPAGVGKTRLASECMASVSAELGYVPVRVAGTQAAAGLPFGAFAPLLPEMPAGVQPSEILRRVSRAISDRGEGRPVIVFVDDAHLLDEASATVTHQFAAGGAGVVLATVRSGEPASDAVIGLWKDGLAERVELSALSRAQVDELLTTVLGGPVDGATARLLWERTQGNALFLRELVTGALAAGVLGHEGEVWRLRGTLPASDRLVELVEGRLAGLSGDQRAVLETVALAEPAGVEIIDPEGAGELETLERQGLLRLDEDGRRLQVRLGHPLYGDVLRSRLSPLRARSVRRGLADNLEHTGARRREDLLRMACWRLDGGGDVDPALLLAAARQAHARSDPMLAERLSRSAWEAGGGFEAGLLLGKVLCQLGRPDEARANLVTLVSDAADDGQRASLAIATADSLYELGLTSEAIAVSERSEAAIGDPAARAEVSAVRMVFMFAAGQVHESRALGERLLDEAEGRALAQISSFVGLQRARTGRFGDALAACDHGLAVWARVDSALPWTQQEHSLAKAYALLLAGHLRDAAALALEGYDRAVAEGWPFGQGNSAWTLMNIRLAEGRVEDSARWGRIAVGIYRNLGHSVWLSWTLVFVAHSLALAGWADEAAGALGDVDALTGATGSPCFDPIEQLRAHAWAAVAAGDVPRARSHLLEASSLAKARGEFAPESSVLHDLARLGSPAEVSARLDELASLVEGPLAPLRAAHARALVDGKDPAAVEAASAAFEELGFVLLAAEAAADAAVAWRRSGDPRRAAAAERRAGGLAGRCEGAKTPALTGVSVRATLTPRELEIARLAAAGVPNRDIADRLYLSRRTVENKLHAAYEKLGVDGRHELAEALEAY